jgi:arabinosaccharide transport system substrate-binding protein
MPGMRWGAGLSPGAWVIVALALISAPLVALRSGTRSEDTQLWTFSRMHSLMYRPVVEAWNESREPTIDLSVLSLPALERRMLGGFLSGVPTADLLEVERRIASRAFSGPIGSVGFVDLTDRLRSEGLLDAINGPSFSAWTTRGRIFGLPHDVHPVMLCYRADIVEAAGIDVSRIETWDDFADSFRPLLGDADGNGEPDRYAISFWPASHMDHLEVLLLQAGGGFFDERDRVRIATEINARVLATLATWVAGPGRIAADAPEFTASGNRLKIDGYVLAAVMPDWLCNIWKNDMPQLSGALKLMPLPAWEPGGRRTSVWGGTMLGIPKSAEGFDELWAFAKHLYLSDEIARELYRTADIVTPIRSHWDDPVFDVPDPYFSGQAKGRLYIDLAGDVPRRTASPYNTFALQRVQDALLRLVEHAERTKTYDRGALMPEAMRLLEQAEREVRKQVDRNVFWGGSAETADGATPGEGGSS